MKAISLWAHSNAVLSHPSLLQDGNGNSFRSLKIHTADLQLLQTVQNVSHIDVWKCCTDHTSLGEGLAKGMLSTFMPPSSIAVRLSTFSKGSSLLNCCGWFDQGSTSIDASDCNVVECGEGERGC